VFNKLVKGILTPRVEIFDKDLLFFQGVHLCQVTALEQTLLPRLLPAQSSNLKGQTVRISALSKIEDTAASPLPSPGRWLKGQLIKNLQIKKT
jgi:hypothetical protein